jgi:hypothetical protein
VRHHVRVLIVRRVPRHGARVSAALTTAESTVALTIAHSAAGGDLPGVVWLLPAMLLGHAASLLVFSSRASVRLVLPALVAVQLLLHAWLHTLAGAGDPAGAAGAAHAAHAGLPLGLSGPMLAAHVAAGLVTALAWLLRRRAVDVLVTWASGPALPVPLLGRLLVAATHLRAAVADLAVAPSRGPPVGAPARI